MLMTVKLLLTVTVNASLEQEPPEVSTVSEGPRRVKDSKSSLK
jgi:hypothetical protein